MTTRLHHRHEHDKTFQTAFTAASPVLSPRSISTTSSRYARAPSRDRSARINLEIGRQCWRWRCGGGAKEHGYGWRGDGGTNHVRCRTRRRRARRDRPRVKPCATDGKRRCQNHRAGVFRAVRFARKPRHHRDGVGLQTVLRAAPLNVPRYACAQSCPALVPWRSIFSVQIFW